MPRTITLSDIQITHWGVDVPNRRVLINYNILHSFPTRAAASGWRTRQRDEGLARRRAKRVLYGPPAARRSSAATAGSVLPSKNSRKAPPPVEM